MFHCHKEVHFKRDCLERKKRSYDKPMNSSNLAVALENVDSAEVLAITQEDSSKEWILMAVHSTRVPIKAHSNLLKLLMVVWCYLATKRPINHWNKYNSNQNF